MDCYEFDKLKADFAALHTTITSVYELRGIGVSAVYVRKDLMDWIVQQEQTSTKMMSQDYLLADIKFGQTKSGSSKVTMRPYGADHPLPVKGKYSGRQPWKIVVTYKKEDA